MIFLLEYDRHAGRLITFKSFGDNQRSTAEDERLDIELNLSEKGQEHEVVLLEAIDETALRHTHRRYFEDLAEIVKSANGNT